MSIPTSRTNENAEIIIDTELCNGCGVCVSVCKDFNLILENGKVRLSVKPVFGCMACGHCMAICPNDAIQIFGRTLSPEDLFNIPGRNDAATYGQLLALLQRRRSIREFKDKCVEPEKAKMILTAAKTAPMGLPPSDVNVLVFDSKEKNHAFAKDFCEYLEGLKWMVSDWFLTLMHPFWSKANDKMFRGFLKPLFDVYIGNMRNCINVVNYDAPLAMYFYGSAFTDPADPIVAATYAMIAGESLGLGTCMLGGIHPFIQKGRKAKLFREKYGIRFQSKEGLFVVFGYPAVKYAKGIRRTFASVVTVN
ncbi:MAG: nitroreductase family protein [Ignavibacteria bacterium]|nr:nitroreductase family protein [Ignavibacteria bacterium]